MTVPYTFANRTGNIPLSELDANFSNVGGYSNTAGTVTTASQPNITLVGTLTSLTVSGSGSMASLTVSGNITADNIIGTVSGNISNAEFATSAATVTTNAQPNITSVGTLSSLTVTANISTNGNLIVVGNVEPGNIVSTGLIRAVTIQATGNLVGGNANISNSVNTLLVNAANITAGNISSVRITTTGNITSSGNVSGNYFIGNGSQLTGVISSYGNSNVAAYLPNYTGNISAGNIAVSQNMTVAGNISGNLTTAAQPNITSVGTLGSLNVTGNITVGNVSGAGAGLSALTGANVTGTVANATSATTAGTVTTAAQPNITSLGTLTSITSSGNVTGANVNATGNVTGGNVISTDFMKALTVQATGNLTGGNANITNAVNAVNGNFTNVAATLTTAAQPYITSVGNLVSLSVTGNVSVGDTLSSLPQTKASNATGTTGQICWDSNYIYVCTATDTWKRAGLIGGY
jgi:hypothetical protein